MSATAHAKTTTHANPFIHQGTTQTVKASGTIQLGEMEGKTKPKTASLLKHQTVEGLSFDDALQLLSLPRLVGIDPESGEEIRVQNGRYGPYLTKGKQIYVEGRIQTRSYDDKDGRKVWTTEVVADDVILLGGRGEGGPSGGSMGGDEYGEPMRSAPRPRSAASPAPMSGGVTDDDVPF